MVKSDRPEGIWDSVYWPMGIFLGALGIRIILLALGMGSPSDSGDAPSYISIAHSLLSGHGYSEDGVNPTALRMPFYPLFLAGIFFISNTGLVAVKIVQSIVGSASCVFVFLLARNLIGSKHGVIAGILAACYLPWAFMDVSILSESLYMFLIAAMLVFLTAHHRKMSERIVFSGLFAGLAALTRPNGIITVLFIGVGLILIEKYRRFAPVFLAVAVIVILPWIARNALVFHRFMPTSSLSGLALYNSYVLPKEGFGFNTLDGLPDEFFALQDEGKKDAFLVRHTVSWIARHPKEVLKLLVQKVGFMVYPFDMQWLEPSFPTRYNFFWGMLLALCIMGAKDGWRLYRRNLFLLVPPILSLLLTVVVFYGSPRLRMPYDFILMVPASLGFVCLFENHHRRIMIPLFFAFHFLLGVVGLYPQIFLQLKTWILG